MHPAGEREGQEVTVTTALRRGRASEAAAMRIRTTPRAQRSPDSSCACTSGGMRHRLPPDTFHVIALRQAVKGS